MNSSSSKKTLIQKPIYGVLAVLCLSFMTVQIVRWKGFALQITWLQLQNLTVGLHLAQLREWGSICNTLQNWKCSEKVFSQMIREDSGHRAGLANYGISLVKQYKWVEAQQAFDRYFQSGGEAADVMFWQAQTLARLNRNDLALEWFYKSLSKRPNESEVIVELVDHLMKMGRFDEALSVVGSFTGGYPERDPFWNTKMLSMRRYINAAAPEETVTAGDDLFVRLPAIIGRNHYLPVEVEGSAAFHFFILDTESAVITMPQDLLQLLWMSRKPASSLPTIKSNRVQLSELNVGPWTLKNVDVVICQSCRPRIGKFAVNHLTVETFLEDQTEFLLVSKSKKASSQ